MCGMRQYIQVHSANISTKIIYQPTICQLISGYTRIDRCSVIRVYIVTIRWLYLTRTKPICTRPSKIEVCGFGMRLTHILLTWHSQTHHEDKSAHKCKSMSSRKSWQPKAGVNWLCYNKHLNIMYKIDANVHPYWSGLIYVRTTSAIRSVGRE